VFKQPACPSCTHFAKTILQDGQEIVRCEFYTHVKLTPSNLAQDCNGFNDLLKDKYWEEFNKATTEIHIIGSKKLKAAGFAPLEGMKK